MGLGPGVSSLPAVSGENALNILDSITKTADGVFAIGPDDRVILWNHAAEQMLGYSADEALGKFCYELLPGKDSSGNSFCFQGCSVMRTARQGQVVNNYDIEMTTKAGEKGFFNVSIISVPGSGDGQPLIVHLFRPREEAARIEEIADRVTEKVLEVLQPEGHKISGPQEEIKTKFSLTPRETEILILLAQCLGTHQIAERLCISRATVRTHIQHILEKLEVHSMLEAVALAFRYRLLPPQ